jgi:secreted Zn-dependent insulinase-like peptidase
MKHIDRDYLIEWFNVNYGSNRMNLVVVGKETTDELVSIVTELFSPINPTSSIFEIPKTKIFDHLKRKMVWINPIKDNKSLSLSWEIPFTFINLYSKPANLVSHLIGNESKGSLLSQLKEREWVESLSAGPYTIGFENVLFEISVTLTLKGLRESTSVISFINDYIKSLQDKVVPKVYLYNIALCG